MGTGSKLFILSTWAVAPSVIIYMPNTQTIRSKSTRFRFKEPSMYDVIMHNDDVTTMEFVIMVLIRVFHKKPADAERLMLKIHHEGSAVAGTYTKDIAQSKADLTMRMARAEGFPLKVTLEERIV